MSETKLNAIINSLIGLKAYEWSRVKIAVERMYSSASAKIELGDAEEIRKNLELELKEMVN